jgi:hypothetical protein
MSPSDPLYPAHGSYRPLCQPLVRVVGLMGQAAEPTQALSTASGPTGARGLQSFSRIVALRKELLSTTFQPWCSFRISLAGPEDRLPPRGGTVSEGTPIPAPSDPP